MLRIGALALMGAGLVVAQLLTGSVATPWTDALAATYGGGDPIVADIVREVRLPRLLAAAFAGASLGLAGALLQSATGNPLAEPGLVGVAAGATLGVVCLIVIGSWMAGDGVVRQLGLPLPVAGMAGGLLGAALTMLAGWRGTGAGARLIVAGVLVGAACASATGTLLLMADENQARLVVNWSIGSIEGRVWSHVGHVWPGLVVGAVVALALARPLDALALGEATAISLGSSPAATRVLAFGAAVVLTAGAVSAVGAVGFVGLAAPHLVGAVMAQGHRAWLVASTLAGCCLLLAADLAARAGPRMLWDGGALPVGALTPVLAAPLFIRVATARTSWIR